MTRVCLEIEMLKINYFVTNPEILTSSLPSHSPVLGFKVVQGKVHWSHTQNLGAILSITQFLRGDSCSVRGHRQTVTVMVLAQKSKEMPKHSNVDSFQQIGTGRCSQQQRPAARRVAQASRYFYFLPDLWNHALRLSFVTSHFPMPPGRPSELFCEVCGSGSFSTPPKKKQGRKGQRGRKRNEFVHNHCG